MGHWSGSPTTRAAPKGASSRAAAYGFCPAKSQWAWGLRLVLLVDRLGLPVGYTLTGANEKEYESVRELALADGCLSLIADKGLWGREYAETLRLSGIVIRTPDRRRGPDTAQHERGLARVRLVVESTIANLKCQMRLEQHLPKPPPGSANGSRNACSHSRSACSSTPSPHAHRERSSPMTAANSTSSL